jgi:hydrogenase expression/formation protein HypD
MDAACELAQRPGVTICTYGDMVRVPGRATSLERLRGDGARVAVVYSARDAVRFAAEHPEQQVVFLAVGFETTAPATAAAVQAARRAGLRNFTILAGHKRVMPALRALLAAGELPIDGFLCPGHVSVIIGAGAYRPLVQEFGRPCVVAGFEPEQMLRGLARLVALVKAGTPAVENVYSVAVTEAGNAAARACLDDVFVPGDARWRALGVIPDSGLDLRPAFAAFDAARRFGVSVDADYEAPGCRCGEVIQGRVEPPSCTLFGTACTPAQPVGPCMVSSEGTCAAWFKYGQDRGVGVAEVAVR